MEILARSDRPTAIFAANDLMAYGVIDAARILGLRVPEDLSVGGFDDIRGAAESVPALTTVVQPMFDLGRVAARFLVKVLSEAEPSSILHQKLHTRLVIRSSTALPSQEHRSVVANVHVKRSQVSN